MSHEAAPNFPLLHLKARTPTLLLFTARTLTLFFLIFLFCCLMTFHILVEGRSMFLCKVMPADVWSPEQNNGGSVPDSMYSTGHNGINGVLSKVGMRMLGIGQ